MKWVRSLSNFLHLTSLNPCKIHTTTVSNVQKITSVVWNSQLNKYVTRNYIIRTLK
jgi:hypothetical protein